MRPSVALLVCLCAVTAGCGGGASGDGGRTVNPQLAGTPSPTLTPSATPTPARLAGYPVAENGSIRVRALTAAHERALTNRSVTVTVSTRVIADDGRLLADRDQRSYAAGDRQFYRTNAVERRFRRPGNRTETVAYWRNDSITVQRWEFENGSATVDVVEGGFPSGLGPDFDPTGAGSVEDLIGRYNLTYAGTVTSDGETLHLVRAAKTDQPTVPTRTDVRVRMTLTDEGYVRELDVRYRTRAFGIDSTVRRRLVVTNVSNTTVPRPEWVNETLRGRSDSPVPGVGNAPGVRDAPGARDESTARDEPTARVAPWVSDAIGMRVRDGRGIGRPDRLRSAQAPDKPAQAGALTRRRPAFASRWR